MHELNQLLNGQTIDQGTSCALFERLIAGQLNQTQITALLVAMKVRGERPEEIAGAAQALRAQANFFPRPTGLVADTCGTGGDASHSINISTAAALVAASMGMTIAKHGNRSVSSASGSADVLEKLGISINNSAQQSRALLDDFGFCFLFAPHYHPGVRYAMPARQELRTRTLFNLLGPLINPAQPDLQVLGVYDPTLCQPLAETLQRLGCHRALVIHGSGLDEFALHGPTQVTELHQGELRHYQLTPSDFGLPNAPMSALTGGDAAKNAQLLTAVFQGQGQAAHNHAIAMNVAALLYLSGQYPCLKEGTQAVLEHLNSAATFHHLERMQNQQKNLENLNHV